jgi:GH18 family chitinase
MSTTTPIVAAYFPEWAIYGRDVQIADVPADRLTHLIYAFTRIGSDGRMQLFDSYAATEKRFTDPDDAVGGKADSWFYAHEDPRSAQTVFGNFNQIAELKELHQHLRTSVAIGGWTLSGNFSTTLDTAAEREMFTQSVVNFLRTYTMFDGVDFDWEYPGGGGLDSNAVSPDDGANYVATLGLLRQKLNALGGELGRRYEISVASAAGVDKISAFQLGEMKEFVDFFNVMTYDFHGTWESSTGHQAPLTGDAIGYDISTAIDRYLQAGVDPSQILLGAPAYTRAWTGVQSSSDDYGVNDYGYGDSATGAAPGSFEAGVYDYKDLLAQWRAGGWQLIWDDNAQAAYLWNPAERIFSSFETPATIAMKSAWAREKGLGGMMFWDLSNDALGDPDSLIEAAADYWLDGRSFAEIAAATGLQFDAIISGNGLFDLADVLQDPTAGGPSLPVVPQPEVLQPLAPTPLVPTPVEPTPAPTVSSGGITVDLQLSSQWGGAFEGQLLLTNQGGQALSQWSVSFSSRYELRGLSDFSLQQSRQADSTWLVTLRPPSWGTTLQPGSTARSYVQGLIPGGGQLASLDADLVLTAPGSAALAQPLPTPEPVTLVAPTPAPTPAPQPPVLGNGRMFAINPAAEDIVGFDPAVDRLDFGDVSVHNLIVAKTASGEVAIVNPWAWSPEEQVLRGIAYTDLTSGNFGVVINEHLRQDIGGVLSWESGVGPRVAGTVYVRSHEYGVREVVENFNPSANKLSFLYFGTRERLTVSDTPEGLLISVAPTGQSLLLAGVRKADLVPANVEFHHDQVVEDQLEVPFGFTVEQVTLVSRAALLTPLAPAGEVTDGHQTSPGSGHSLCDCETAPAPAPVPTPAPTPTPAAAPAPTPQVPTPVEPTPAPTVSSGGITVDLQLSSQWGGAFEGQLLLTNQGGQALSQWSVSFSSRYELRGLSDFSLQQSRQADSTWLVTLRPPSWGTTLQPGSTARSYVQGLIPGGGQLASLDADLVLTAPGSAALAQPLPTPEPVTLVAPTPLDPITGGGGSTSPVTPAPMVDVHVGSSDTLLQARGDQAELFRLGYAWGRQLTIEGFNPNQDRLDLRNFWGEGQQARVLGSAEGVRVELPFNQQAVLLPGVTLEQWHPQGLEVWAG